MTIDARRFMLLPLNLKIFKEIFEIKEKDLEPVLNQYNVNKQSLCDMLWEELNIPGMEIRIASTAVDFLIECCEEGKDLEATLRGEIKKDILMAGIFYTNIAPEAVCLSEFSAEL